MIAPRSDGFYAGRRWAVAATIVLFLPASIGCLDFTGQRSAFREKLRMDRSKLEAEVKRHIPLFNERDMLRQQLSTLESQIEQIEAAIKTGAKK